MSSTPPRVFVTGARRGIGRGTALAFAERGWDVVVNDLVEDGDVQDTLDAIRLHGGRAAFVGGDIADLSRTKDLVEAAWAAFGGIETLVNNAGISVARRGDMLDVTPESFDRLMAVNLRGPFFLTQELARRWLADAAPDHPRSVINIASANSSHASPDRAEYCLSKTGVSMMTQLYALRLAEAGIGVFEIRPGIIRTDMTRVAAERYNKLIVEGISPIRRWGEPADIGGVAITLAEGKFHFSTGEVVHVDGGLHIARL